MRKIIEDKERSEYHVMEYDPKYPAEATTLLVTTDREKAEKRLDKRS